MKKVLIIGAGAVGVAIAAGLENNGMEVAVLSQSKTADAIEKNGVERTGIFGNLKCEPGRVKVFKDYASIDSAFDYVIISSKTMANATIAKELNNKKDILADSGVIVIFQNGWGNEKEFLKYFDKSQIYNARIITGFERKEANISNVTAHTAPILLGSLFGMDNSIMEPLAEAINASGIPSEVSDEIEKALWAKMLFNTTLNPLGAILKKSYGELSEVESSVSIMNQLIEETYKAMDSEGYKSFWANAEEYKKFFYEKLIPDTYKHRSSTLQDIEKGQKTEIDTLNGCIIDIADRNGVEVPGHKMIYRLIKSIEAK